MKKVFLKTFGCQMNLRDSEVVAGLLQKSGYKVIDSPEKADVVIFNTCSVRQHAEDKVWSEIGRLSKVNKPRATAFELKPIIGIVGCMAQNYKDTVFRRSPGVDFVIGPADIDKIPRVVEKLTAVNRGLANSDLYAMKIWETDGQERPEVIYHTGFHEDKNHAYVVISEGCSNYCSYCVVPYVRGSLRHRSRADILTEIKEAIDKGITEITLLGQNVNAYCDNEVNFVGLLKLVNSIRGLKEFSFITSHPKDTSADLFQAMAELRKLKKYLHLPAQSGSDRILGLMNRGYTRKFYLDLADDYRKIVKGGILTTDIIVGFPTETDEDFRQTYGLVDQIQFDVAYIFKYSPRPHTEAERLNDDVPRPDKEKRHKLILDLQRQISKKKPKL
ncbi:MAG: tRNA (N6-isopentenyl adenosine(37)-C2)-methylthiotransferase MiaB [Deltaproteobacteria bacterium]